MKNRKPYSTLYKVFYRVPVSLANVLAHVKPWVLDARKNTYYSEKPLKSKLHIFADHLFYAFVQGNTVKDDYYAMGIDQKGKRAKDYLAETVNTLALYAKNTARGLTAMKWHYDMCAVLKDKWIFSQICKAYNLSTPHTFGLLNMGNVMSQELKDLNSFLKRDFNVMFKPVDGACGIGIVHVRSIDGKLIVKGKEISVEQLKDMLGNGRYLIQQFVSNQHEGMIKLYPDACNTLRITVARDGNETRVLGRMCMLGAHGTDCSNWHFGGVSVNIKEDGTLDKYGFCKIDKKVTAHPDTGVTFEGYKIPFFDEAIALAKRATECFYGFCSIGWDIAITTDGPIIIEGNDDWGIVAHQMVENRGWLENWEQSHGKLNI
jgi:hypothetical protein